MANTLNSLANDIFKASQIVEAETIGYIPAVTLNSNETVRVAQGDTVRSAFAPVPTVNSTATPAMTPPAGDDQVIASKTTTLDQVARVTIPWTGEEQKHVNNGAGYKYILSLQIEQALRAINNQIEAHVGLILKRASSRAVGTAGTTPFASNHDLISDVRLILEDNGCPFTDMHLVLSNRSAAAMRKLAPLYKANEAGTDATLRKGMLLDLDGFRIHQSAGNVVHTKGTGASYLVNNAGPYAIGSESIIIDTGTGTILAGDVFTATGDTNIYAVNTGFAGDGDGTIVIGTPGLRATLANNVALTLGNSYTPNMAFHRNAVELAIRKIAIPEEGDLATDEYTFTSPTSGIVYEFRVYKGYKKVTLEIAVLYGAKVWMPQFVATLMG